MKDFFKSRSFKVLIGAVLVLTGVVLVTATTGNSVISSIVGFVTTPVQQLSNQAADAAGAVSPSGKTMEELEAENAQLREKLTEMIALTVDYYDIKRENEQNVKYLELKEQKKDYQFALASVIGRDPADLFYGFTIDQGSLSGVAVNDPVITDRGLVGWVSAVYPTYSRVTTILSPETNVSVLDQVTQDTGVVSGSMEYAENGQVEMRFLTAQNQLEEGDIIVTSGVGGIYPGELPVGEVVEKRQEENADSITAVIQPYEDIKVVTNVCVITDFLGQGSAMPEIDASQDDSSSSAEE